MDSDKALQGIFLIVSNVGIVPAIAISIVYKLIPEAIVYTIVFVVSTLYHACQAGFFCVYSFKTLQTTDHFFVFSLLVWTTLYFIGLTIKIRFIVFVIIQAFILPAVIDYIESWWIGGILLAFLVIFSLFSLSFITHEIPKPGFIDLLAALLFIGAGFSFHLYGGEPGEESYWWSHSIWHLLGMFSLYFVIEMKSGKGTLHNLLLLYKKDMDIHSEITKIV